MLELICRCKTYQTLPHLLNACPQAFKNSKINQVPQFLTHHVLSKSICTEDSRKDTTNARLADNLKKMISTLVMPPKRMAEFTSSQVTLYLSMFSCNFLLKSPIVMLIKV